MRREAFDPDELFHCEILGQTLSQGTCVERYTQESSRPWPAWSKGKRSSVAPPCYECEAGRVRRERFSRS